MHDLLCVHCDLWLLEGKALARRQVFVSPLLKRLHVHYDHPYLRKSPCVGCKLINKAVQLMPDRAQTDLPQGTDVQVVPFDYSVPGYDTRDIRFILDALPTSPSGEKVWRSCLYIDNVHHSIYMHFEARYTLDAANNVSFKSVSEYVKPRFDVPLIQRWMEVCDDIHKEENTHSEPPSPLPHGFRVIDLQRRCLVTPSDPDTIRFVTFSSRPEAWPHAAAGFDQFTTPGSFDRLEIPQKLRDSIDLCQQLGERYMWVERMCMPGSPKNDDEQALYSKYLAAVFRATAWTLVCALDDGESQHLPGYKRDRGWEASIELRPGSYGSNKMYTYDSIYDAVNATSCGAGEWAAPEQKLSPRKVYITKKQVLFQCKCGLAQEYLTWGHEATDKPEILDRSFLKTSEPLNGVAAIRAFLTDSETKAQITSDQEALEYLDSMSQKKMETIPSVMWHEKIQVLKKEMTDRNDVPGWIEYSRAAFATQTYLDALLSARHFFQCYTQTQVLMLRLRYCKWTVRMSLLPDKDIYQSILAAERLFKDVQISWVAEQKVVEVHHFLSQIWICMVRGEGQCVHHDELDRKKLDEVIACIAGLFAWRRHFEVYDQTQFALEGLQRLVATTDGSFKVTNELCMAIKTTQSFIGRLWRLYQHYAATIVEESCFRNTGTLYLLFDNLTEIESRVGKVRRYCETCSFEDINLDTINALLDPPDLILPDMETLPFILQDIMNVFHAVDACDWYGGDSRLLLYLKKMREHPSCDESIDIIINYIDQHPHHMDERAATEELLVRYPLGKCLDPLRDAKRQISSLKSLEDMSVRALLVEEVLQEREAHFRDLWMLSTLYNQVYQVATCCGSWSRTKALLEGMRILGVFANRLSDGPDPRWVALPPQPEPQPEPQPAKTSSSVGMGHLMGQPMPVRE